MIVTAATAALLVEIETISIHWLRAVFMAFWLLLLLVPLSRIERRDILTGLDYVGFCLAAGVAMVWGMPLALPIESRAHDAKGHLLWFGAIVALTVWRYYYNRPITKDPRALQNK